MDAQPPLVADVLESLRAASVLAANVARLPGTPEEQARRARVANAAARAAFALDDALREGAVAAARRQAAEGLVHAERALVEARLALEGAWLEAGAVTRS